MFTNFTDWKTTLQDQLSSQPWPFAGPFLLLSCHSGTGRRCYMRYCDTEKIITVPYGFVSNSFCLTLREYPEPLLFRYE